MPHRKEDETEKMLFGTLKENNNYNLLSNSFESLLI